MSKSIDHDSKRQRCKLCQVVQRVAIALKPRIILPLVLHGMDHWSVQSSLKHMYDQKKKSVNCYYWEPNPKLHSWHVQDVTLADQD